MLGIVSHSIVPIRLATMMGFFVGTLSLIVGIYYGVMKIIFWDTFPIGIAPLVIGFFFMTSTLLLFLGLMGEYIASIHTYVKNRPIVVEKERINFWSFFNLKEVWIILIMGWWREVRIPIPLLDLGSEYSIKFFFDLESKIYLILIYFVPIYSWLGKITPYE